MDKIIRKDLDKFYTRIEIVRNVVKKLNLKSYDLIIEPSAGSGVFLPYIKKYNYIALDIEPENDLIKKMNWFDFELDNEYKSILVIGNPPFGKLSNLAFDFIKKSAEINAQTIAFILPKSFKKDSYKNRIPLNYKLKIEMDLDDNSFSFDGSDYSVPCVFQVWERTEIKRKKNKLKTKTRYFDFVKKEEKPDLSFRRIGFYAGKLSKDIDKSEESHTFIKLNGNMSLDDVIRIFNKIKWNHNNTVGQKSISRGEIVYEFNRIANSELSKTPKGKDSLFAKKWLFSNLDGRKIHVNGQFEKFCTENKISYKGMRNIAYGRRINKYINSWTVNEIKNLTY